MPEFTQLVLAIIRSASAPLTLQAVLLEIVKEDCGSDKLTVGAYQHARDLDFNVRDACWWLVSSQLAEFTPDRKIRARP